MKTYDIKKKPANVAEKLLFADLKDKQLQRWYYGFIEEQKEIDVQLRSKRELHVVLHGELKKINSVILSLVDAGYPIPEEIRKQRLDVEKKIYELNISLSLVKMQKQIMESKIEFYKKSSDSRLFLHWRYLKELDKDTPPFPEFKKQFEGIII